MNNFDQNSLRSSQVLRRSESTGDDKYYDVDVTFDALSPAMRELPRRVYARSYAVR